MTMFLIDCRGLITKFQASRCVVYFLIVVKFFRITVHSDIWKIMNSCQIHKAFYADINLNTVRAMFKYNEAYSCFPFSGKLRNYSFNLMRLFRVLKLAYILPKFRDLTKAWNVFRESMSYDTFVTTVGAQNGLPCVSLHERDLLLFHQHLLII